jgi:hypothetical protein
MERRSGEESTFSFILIFDRNDDNDVSDSCRIFVLIYYIINIISFILLPVPIICCGSGELDSLLNPSQGRVALHDDPIASCTL